MRSSIWILAAATVLAAGPGAAQETGGSLASMLQAALNLPRATQEARALGVPESDLRGILETARQRRLPAADIAEVLRSENEAIRDHGPIDNFGAFVQARLDEGLRGRDLAAAIRAEHAARGKGNGYGVGRSNAPGGSAGKSESPGMPGAAKKAEAAKGKKGGPR